MSAKRPSLARGLTFPIYTTPDSLVDSTISSLASLNIHTQDPQRPSLSHPSTGNNINNTVDPPLLQPRDTPHSTPTVTPPDAAAPATIAMSQSTTPQSPPVHSHHHSTSSSSSYFPPYAPTSRSYRVSSASNTPAVSPAVPLSSSASLTRSSTVAAAATATAVATFPSTTLPMITSPPPTVNAAFRGHSHSRHRTNVAMSIDSTPSHHILIAPLGDGFSADSITIAARKENILAIFADRWDQEQDCHNEWQVQFGRDSDMSNIHANFDNGVLRITVKRFPTSRP